MLSGVPGEGHRGDRRGAGTPAPLRSPRLHLPAEDRPSGAPGVPRPPVPPHVRDDRWQSYRDQRSGNDFFPHHSTLVKLSKCVDIDELKIAVPATVRRERRCRSERHIHVGQTALDALRAPAKRL